MERRHSFLVLGIFSIVILGGLGLSQDAYAGFSFPPLIVLDEVSCVNILFGDWLDNVCYIYSNLDLSSVDTFIIPEGTAFYVTSFLDIYGNFENHGIVDSGQIRNFGMLHNYGEIIEGNFPIDNQSIIYNYCDATINGPVIGNAVIQVFDGCEQSLGSIAGKAWNDLDMDGIQDDGEWLVEGMLIQLLDGDIVIHSTLTDAAGEYQFVEVPAGDYRVEATPQDGFFLTLQDQGSDDSRDSDANPYTGQTDVITLSSGQTISNVNFGVYEIIEPEPALLKHFYEFKGNFEDTLDGPTLTAPGGGTPEGTLGSYHFEDGQGLELSSPQVSNDNYSIEMCLKVGDGQDNQFPGWRKLVDFKDFDQDMGIYVTGPDFGPPADRLMFYDEATGSSTVPTEEFFHFVLTRDGNTDNVQAYLSGESEFSFTDSGDLAVFDKPNHVIQFIQDDGNGEDPDGTIDYIKVYDGVLDSDEVASNASSCPSQADPITLTGTIRDFCDPAIEGQCIDHPDFEDPPIDGLEEGAVEATLGNDGKPVFAAFGSTQFSTAENFDQWYRDVDGVNTAKQFSITLEPESLDPDVVTFQDGSFFPIDGELFGDQGRSHNYHFTYELPAKFVYQGGEFFEFCGDDDIWVFINNELVIDIGGIHGQTCRDVQLDNLELTKGNTIDFKLFFAERHTSGSNFKAWTNIELEAQEPQITKKNGGDNQWDTRPTFGISHEDRANQVVENGFRFNTNEYMLTDNHHTDFAEQEVEIGTMNSFSATVYADKKLKIQEFLFGIPNVGEAHLAELGVEVWYDRDGNIDDVKVVQKSDVIDADTVSVSHEKVKCLSTDEEAKCDTTTVSMTFLEPLMDKVMAIKAIDYALRDQRTFLNEGFDISGESLNPMYTKMIPSNLRDQGLLKVTQVAKYSPYWTSEDGKMFEMNSFGSFKQINQSFERFQDTGNAFTRAHSAFGGILAYEQDRATDLFDSNKLISKLPESFAYIYPDTGERLTDEMMQQMQLQAEIAQSILDEMDKQDRHY
jgi:fibro-slime domain-containing protein